MHKAFPLLVRKFPLPEGTSHCLKMNATVRRIEMPLPEDCTAIEEKKKKLPVKDRWQLGGSSACYQFFVDLLKHLDREDLNQLWVLVKEYLSMKPALNEKEMELWVELKRLYDLKRLYEPDPEDQLWTQTQNYMHAPIEWKLYDLSGVHHVAAKDKDIFMLVEKDYPLRRGLTLVMICYKLQVKNYSQMVEDLIQKIYTIANSPRQQVRKFPLPEGTSHCLKMNATVRRIEMPLPEDCTAIEEKKKKLPVKDRWQLH
nr:hypothetical protein [Tanacetum cinerariifolium]